MRNLGVVVVAALLGACGGDGPGGSGDDDDGGDRPSPYDDEGETEAEVPSLPPEVLVDASMTGLQTFLRLEPDAVIDSIEGLVAFEDGCPEDQQIVDDGINSVTAWTTQGCTTSAGLEIRGGGYIEHFTYQDGERVVEGVSMYSQAGVLALAAADGRFVEVSGHLYYERGSSPDGMDSYFEVGGNLAADDATAAASPLLDPEIRAQGFMFSFVNPQAQVLGGAGSLSGPVLEGVRAFQFTNLFALPLACGTEPGAVFSLRDDDGYWHDVVFDAATFVEGEDPSFAPDKCDGCGSYLAGGQVRGEVCMTAGQLDSLMQWEDYPW